MFLRFWDFEVFPWHLGLAHLPSQQWQLLLSKLLCSWPSFSYLKSWQREFLFAF
jgi:hypothetical protein